MQTRNASVCNNEQSWNEDKCRCECKEFFDKGVCDKAFIWDPSNYECKCDKSCDIDEYQTMKTVNVRKNQLINQLKNVVKILKNKAS